MTPEQEKQLEALQEIQMANPPSSQAWKDASKQLHELIEKFTGKKPRDARKGD